ncbi:MAG: SDR family NAD(P)-dependent oxidoreductase [Candidatus Omnitrophota bacterium]
MKTALITGSSSGIGRACAEMLKKRGWQVFATARKPEDVRALIDAGFESCALDLDSSSSIKAAADYVLSKTQGKLDALVNNAGFGLTCAVEDLTQEILRKQFDTNLFGLQELTNLLIPVFRRQNHGRIVNVSSIVGRFTLPYMGAYCASKYALEALSDALRLELSDTNISVSIIEPGSIKTKFNDNSLKLMYTLQNKKTSPHVKAYNLIQERRLNITMEGTKAPAEAVAKKIAHALESKRPRARYVITSKARFVWLVKKVSPETLIDFLTKIYLKKRGYK